MAKIDLDITGVERTEFGKGPSRRARRAGNVPAVLYGRDVDPIHIDIPGHDIFLIVKDNANAVVNVHYGKKKQMALVKAIQRHPVRRDIIHVDFQVVHAGEKVEVEIPLLLVGEAAPGTQVEQDEFSILVSAPAISIPEHFEIDIEGKEAGFHFRVEDLVLEEGVEALTEGDRVLVTIAEEQEIVVETEEDAEEALEEAVGEAAADAGASSSDSE